jgi:hypothetical protein
MGKSRFINFGIRIIKHRGCGVDTCNRAIASVNGRQQAIPLIPSVFFNH